MQEVGILRNKTKTNIEKHDKVIKNQQGCCQAERTLFIQNCSVLFYETGVLSAFKNTSFNLSHIGQIILLI